MRVVDALELLRVGVAGVVVGQVVLHPRLKAGDARRRGTVGAVAHGFLLGRLAIPGIRRGPNGAYIVAYIENFVKSKSEFVLK